MVPSLWRMEIHNQRSATFDNILIGFRTGGDCC